MTKTTQAKAAPAAKPAIAPKTFAPIKDQDGKITDWVADHARVDMNDVGFRFGADV